jgi:hypothetical protein
MVIRKVKVHPWTPTPEQAPALRATGATMQWLWDLPDDIRLQYSGQWIAARDCQILAPARTMTELCDKLDNPGDPTIVVECLDKGVTIR